LKKCIPTTRSGRDVAAAISRVREVGEVPTLVAGWSFGASVALREALDDDRVAALALIGYPLAPDVEVPATPAASELRGFRRPVLLLSGETDRYSPPGPLRELAASFRDAVVEIVPGTDHYLWRREREAAEVVGAFAERVLFGQRADV
jgi:pimeloyl-ACP methyl ester carboxylesterase